MVSVVDDDESVREAVEAQMRSFGFDAQAYSSAAAFLASACISSTRCLIADINMPQMSGVQLHRRLTTLGYTIPTILITAYPDDEVRARVLDEGVICYLVKPFDDDELLRCVRLALARPVA